MRMFSNISAFALRHRGTMVTEDLWRVHVLEHEALPYLKRVIGSAEDSVQVECKRLLGAALDLLRSGNGQNATLGFIGSSEAVWISYHVTGILREFDNQANAVYWAERLVAELF